jgi:hypothetical protein
MIMCEACSSILFNTGLLLWKTLECNAVIDAFNNITDLLWGTPICLTLF